MMYPAIDSAADLVSLNLPILLYLGYIGCKKTALGGLPNETSKALCTDYALLKLPNTKYEGWGIGPQDSSSRGSWARAPMLGGNSLAHKVLEPHRYFQREQEL